MLKAVIFIPLDCGAGNMSVVSGDIFGSNYQVDNIFTHNKVDQCYWIAPNNMAGTFIINLGCQLVFGGIQLVNTRNTVSRDRGTKKFR